MRKTIAVVIAVGLVGGALLAAPADAKKRKKKKPVRVERVEEVTYSAPAIGPSTPVATGGICTGAPECIAIPTSATELFVKVEVTDASGQNVSGFLDQGDTNGDGVGDLFGAFCGSMPGFAPLPAPGTELGVSVYNGTCADGSPAVATTGTIKVTFSNMP